MGEHSFGFFLLLFSFKTHVELESKEAKRGGGGRKKRS